MPKGKEMTDLIPKHGGFTERLYKTRITKRKTQKKKLKKLPHLLSLA
jgi:hypothetical protein